MNLTQQPATETQLNYLRQHGVEPGHVLSRAEAVELIRNLGAHGAAGAGAAQLETPFPLRQAVARAMSALASASPANLDQCQRDLERAKKEREGFWLDTCKGTTLMANCTQLVHDLYRRKGCLFCVPVSRQAQDVLNALDGAHPSWDRDHPEIFYQTLELNFPELRHP